MIASLLAQDELPASPPREELRIPANLPPHLQELYRTPLLTRSRERALFLQFNYHKFQFAQLRGRLDPELARKRDLDALERQLSLAAEARNAIVRANLRLVVSVAKRHLRGGPGLPELLSEGSLVLMHAADSFDIGRGNRFSTYATWALMKSFARAVPQMSRGRGVGIDDADLLRSVPDEQMTLAASRLADREQVGVLLSRLSERERTVLSAHFGLEQSREPATYEQVAQRLGLSKQRVREIEVTALAKLRIACGSGI